MEAEAVLKAARALPVATLLAASGVAFASYLAYAGFDLLGRRYTGHGLGTPQVIGAGLLSHAFALNLGPAGVLLRFRIYGRLGVRPASVARVWAVCMVSNWLGLSMLAGLALSVDLGGLRGALPLPEPLARALGIALLALAPAYAALCRFGPRRPWRAFGQTVALPSARFAGAQFAASVIQWLLVAGILAVLFEGAVPFATVLAALLFSALALAVVDVPGGLGVTEAVFLALLSGALPAATVLVALLAFRIVYCVAPLLLAALAYVKLELQASPAAEAAR